MENKDPEKDGIREAKKYASLSTRLPGIDAVRYILFCRKLGTNTSERIRQLILQDLAKPKKHMLAGVNRIKYNKIDNSFSWLVQLDSSGKEIEILKNLSDNFLRNLKQEIDEAIKERNSWVHQTQSSSVDIPVELIGGEDG